MLLVSENCHKGAASLTSDIQWWVKRGWGLATDHEVTDCHQCFASLSALARLDSWWEGIQPVKYVPSQKILFQNSWRKKLMENSLIQVHLEKDLKMEVVIWSWILVKCEFMQLTCTCLLCLLLFHICLFLCIFVELTVALVQKMVLCQIEQTVFSDQTTLGNMPVTSCHLDLSQILFLSGIFRKHIIHMQRAVLECLEVFPHLNDCQHIGKKVQVHTR